MISALIDLSNMHCIFCTKIRSNYKLGFFKLRNVYDWEKVCTVAVLSSIKKELWEKIILVMRV